MKSMCIQVKINNRTNLYRSVKIVNKKRELKFSRFTCGYLMKNTVYCVRENVFVGGDGYVEQGEVFSK